MRRLLLLSAAAAVAAAAVAATYSGEEPGVDAESAAAVASSQSAQSVERRFVGNYELVSFEVFPEDGEAVDRDYVGRILYDEDGNMSAVGMPRDLPDRFRASEGDDGPRTGFAYFGTFDVDPRAGTVTHHVRGSPMDPEWVGTDLVRYYELDGELLMLSLKDDDGRTTATLTWRRY